MQARSDKIRGALVEGMEEEENLCFLTLSSTAPGTLQRNAGSLEGMLSQDPPWPILLSLSVLREASLPVDSDDPEGEHAGWADEQVEEGWEVAPDHSEDPFPPDGAGHHERQHQDRQQEVGQGQAEDEPVAEGKQVGLPVQGDHDEQVAQADKNGDDDDGDELCDDDAPLVPGRLGEVPQLLPVAEGGVEVHGQCTSAGGGPSMLDGWNDKPRGQKSSHQTTACAPDRRAAVAPRVPASCPPASSTEAADVPQSTLHVTHCIPLNNALPQSKTSCPFSPGPVVKNL